MNFVSDIPSDIIEKYKDYYILAVIGSRSIIDKELIRVNLDYLINSLIKVGLTTKDKLIILSGGAKGVDRLAAQYASDSNILNINILPNWNLLGEKAGFVRNENIIKYSHRIIAFQSNNSPGTQNGINHAIRMKKKLNIVNI